ncbi:MAG: viperin family antiviral radical SAM protein [Archangium sp.]|nr:viperin family antiviral radical SAM protein [Archangium sp.]
MSKLVVPEVVNLHITSVCNLHCTYCYAQYPEIVRPPPRCDWPKIITLLAEAGVKRVNFAGGEPTLVRDLPLLLQVARAQGLKTSIVSNGKQLTDKTIELCDAVALSLDSADDHTNAAIGRVARGTVTGSYAVFIGLRAARVRALGRALKINTVVTQLNVRQDLRAMFRRLRPVKVKLLQFRQVIGENDKNAAALEVSPTEFESFVERHLELRREGIRVQPESADVLGSSYVMINPEGRLFQNGPNGRYLHSAPVIEIGFEAALAEVGGYDRAAFVGRGGDLDVSKWGQP